MHNTTKVGNTGKPLSQFISLTKKTVWRLLPAIFILVIACHSKDKDKLKPSPTPNPAPVPINPNCQKGELTFDNAPFVLNANYTNVGFLSNGFGFTDTLIQFQLPNKTYIFNKSYILNTPPHPFGNGQMIRMNNTALKFTFINTVSTTRISFEYLSQGGAINLAVDSTKNMYTGNISTMPNNFVINGINLIKSNVVDIRNPQNVKVAEKGTITLKSSTNIIDMIIGGQELFLDNFCMN